MPRKPIIIIFLHKDNGERGEEVRMRGKLQKKEKRETEERMERTRTKESKEREE
jgi:hypothetical protein